MPKFMTSSQRGFTLVEAVIVIVITGIVAAVVAVFIRAPVQGYVDAARRAELTDMADTAVRRISRDLHTALPNSVRVTPDGQAIEFLPTSDGGRYRAETDGAGADTLDFGQNDATSAFNILGPPITFAAGDQIVIYNLGIPGADAYEGNNAATHNRRAFNGAPGTLQNVAFTPATPFPFESPGNRFHVVNTPVTYICNAGVLWRYWGYPIPPNQPATIAALNALNPASARLAEGATCFFTYSPGISQRSDLVAIQLTLTQDGETVNLYQEVHVSNVP
jgi:MSHA biogenesis protein MshO